MRLRPETPAEAATHDALSRLAEGGSDLTRPMPVDFHLVVPHEAAGQRIRAAAEAAGFSTELWQDEETGWTCECSRDLVPTAAAIAQLEQLLNGLAAPEGGFCEGWGSFGNAPGSRSQEG